MPRILTWVVTVVLGILIILFIIGYMAQANEPFLRGAGPKDEEEQVPAGPAYELPTFNHFLAAALSGKMPGNVTSEFPAFPWEGMEHFSKPYAEWAPEPFSQLPGPQGPLGGTEKSPAPIIRVMHVMSGLDDILEDAFSHVMGGKKGPETVERSFRVMKTKIWLGMAPVSDARWKAKGLDQEANIEEALAIIQQVVSVFDYLRKPEIQGSMRHIYNKIWAEIDVFQDACNALRTERGEAAPDWNLTKLWSEYNKLHFSFFERQARSWTFSHLKTLYGIWKSRFLTTLQSGRELNATQTTVRIDHYAMLIMSTLLDLYRDADLFIRARTDGFVFPTGIHPALAGVSDSKEKLNGVYSRLEEERIGLMGSTLQKVVDEQVATREKDAPSPSFMKAPNLLVAREWGHKSLQPEIENPLERQIEPSVQTQSSDTVERFGFVIFRLSYKESDAEWKAFVRKLKEGVGSGWEGVLGGERIRGKAKLHWVDGKVKGIGEGDVDAARTAFQKLKESKAIADGISTTFFLAVTPQSRKSFTDIPETDADQQGDYRGFLHVVSADFTPTEEGASASRKGKRHAPGYDGTFKIIDQLIWTDLFAMTSTAAQDAETYWALAAQHPWGVYVGPTTGVRRRMWREMNGVLGGMVEVVKAAGEL